MTNPPKTADVAKVEPLHVRYPEAYNLMLGFYTNTNFYNSSPECRPADNVMMAIEYAHQALSPARGEGWQPLETAPFDRMVLVDDTRFNAVCEAIQYRSGGWTTFGANGPFRCDPIAWREKPQRFAALSEQPRPSAPSEVSIPAGMKAWAGGDRAPEDWNGGEVYLDWGDGNVPRFTACSADDIDWKPDSWRSDLDRDTYAIIIAYEPKSSCEVPPFPSAIGRLHLGDKRSDGERLCTHSHPVSAGHPLYWPEQMGQYDDSDPYCLEHAIERALDDERDYTPKAPSEVSGDREALRKIVDMTRDSRFPGLAASIAAEALSSPAASVSAEAYEAGRRAGVEASAEAAYTQAQLLGFNRADRGKIRLAVLALDAPRAALSIDGETAK